MLEANLVLRIASVFILAIVSMLGVTLPIMMNKKQRESELFIVIKCGAAGVMLGLCLVSLSFLLLYVSQSLTLCLSLL